MTVALDKQKRTYPDHTQLPETDGTFVKNSLEHPQSILLTDSIQPVLEQIHPNGDYFIGQDTGIYWRETSPPERGAEAPDWYYVPGVPARLDGQFRRSYVLWKEPKPPLIALEFASKDGSEERDSTSLAEVRGTNQSAGKFWIYERKICIPYYGIYIMTTGQLEFYCLEPKRGYQQVLPNERGHYPIEEMGVELGVWQGYHYSDTEEPWLRWWNLEGELLLTGAERAEREQQRAEREQQRAEQAEHTAQQERLEKEQARQRAEQERQRAERLAQRLRAMGIDPDQA